MLLLTAISEALELAAYYDVASLALSLCYDVPAGTLMTNADDADTEKHSGAHSKGLVPLRELGELPVYAKVQLWSAAISRLYLFQLQHDLTTSAVLSLLGRIGSFGS